MKRSHGMLAATLVLGCGPNGAHPFPDAGTTTPDAGGLPRCGDGVPDLAGGVETCDDGSANGSRESLCTIDCRDGTVTLMLSRTQTMPFSSRQLLVADVTPDFGANPDVVSLSTDQRVHVVKEWLSFSSLPGPPAPVVALAIGQPARSIAVTQTTDSRVMWIEEPAAGAPSASAYAARFGPGPSEVAISTWTYPFDGTSGGNLVGLGDILYVLDRFADGTLVLAGEDMWGGGLTGTITSEGNGALDVWATVAWTGTSHFVMRHVADPPAAVVYQVDSTTLVLSDPVVTATVPIIRSNGAFGRVAVLLADGTVEIWDLDLDTAEVRRTPFGSVDAGSADLVGISLSDIHTQPAFFAHLDVAVIEPDGELALLVNNGADHALAVQRFSLGASCADCAIARVYGDAGQTGLVVSLDDVLLSVFLRPNP